MYQLTIRFEEKEIEPRTISITEPDTILEILENNGIELHHNCGGVCACSTCQIYVEKGSEHIAESSDKEEDFIDRARNPKLNSRLACQCLLEGKGGVIEITIPDQSIIEGE